MTLDLVAFAAITAGQDPAVISAWLVGLAGLVAAAAGLVKVVVTRPRLPVAEEVMEQLHDSQELLVIVAEWIAAARIAAALHGFELPPLPIKLTMLTHPSAKPAPEKETP